MVLLFCRTFSECICVIHSKTCSGKCLSTLGLLNLLWKYSPRLGKNLTKTSGLLLHHVYYYLNVLSNRYFHSYDLMSFCLSQSLRASYSASVGKIWLHNFHRYKFQVSGALTDQNIFSFQLLLIVHSVPNNVMEISFCRV